MTGGPRVLARIRPTISGGWGDSAGRWKEVADVATDAEDNVYLLTRFPAAVQVLDPGGRLVRTLARGLLSPRPHGVTVGPDGLIYVVDDPLHVVRVLDPAGEQVHVIGTPGAGSATGVDYDQPITRWAASVRRPAAPFNRPTKVALARNGDLFISDGYGNARMHRFDSTGELLGSWGEPGSGPGQFMLPHSVSLLADGRLVVADRENDRLQFFGPDGDFRAQWTCVQRPTAAVQDRAGRIWVSELGWGPGEISGRRARIALGEPPGLRLLDPAGNVVGRWTRLPGGDSFVAPHGLATDSAGNLYIAEVSFSLTGRPQARALHRCAVPAPGPA